LYTAAVNEYRLCISPEALRKNGKILLQLTVQFIKLYGTLVYPEIKRIILPADSFFRIWRFIPKKVQG